MKGIKVLQIQNVRKYERIKKLKKKNEKIKYRIKEGMKEGMK